MFVKAVLPGMLLPFAGTMLGVFPFLFRRRSFSETLSRYLTAFSAGVMTAASIWSLLLPAIERSQEPLAFLPAAVGLLMGGGVIALFERICAHQNRPSDTDFTMLAITLHNFPEGLAVGVALSGLYHTGAVSLVEAMLLSLGIAIQNIPEGAIIFAPLRAKGKSVPEALSGTFLSGIVEPVGALLSFLLTGLFAPLLPYILSFAAGAMLFVVADDMLPSIQAQQKSAKPALVFLLGFALMMILDIALG